MKNAYRDNYRFGSLWRIITTVTLVEPSHSFIMHLSTCCSLVQRYSLQLLLNHYTKNTYTNIMVVKELKLTDKKFTANGKTYLVTDKISMNRYIEYQRTMPLLTFGTNFEEMFKQLKNAYTHLNNQKFADSAVIIHNLLNNVSKVEETSRIHPALKMAAMFINTSEEDVTIYDEEVTKQKIEDWSKEGYNISDFFTLSLNSINGFREAFQEYTEKRKQMES